MTLEEAREKMRELEEVRGQIYDRLGGIVRSDDVDQEDTRALQDNHNHRRTLGYELASYPHIRPHMWCWMVDVVGRENNMATSEEFGEGLEMLLEGDKESFAARSGSALGQEVREFIVNELRMEPTDSGGGCGGWHIGTPCDQAEMEVLTGALHGRFGKAIKAGILFVQVKFWGWRFKETP